jgi:hypothetical protein
MSLRTKAELQELIREAKARIPDMQSPAGPLTTLPLSEAVQGTETPPQPILPLDDSFASGEPAAKKPRLSEASMATSVTDMLSSVGGSIDGSPAVQPDAAAKPSADLAADDDDTPPSLAQATSTNRRTPVPLHVKSGIPDRLLTASTLSAIPGENMLIMADMALVTEINNNGSKKKIISLLAKLGASRACAVLSKVEATVVLFNVRGVIGAVENVDDTTWNVEGFAPYLNDYNEALFPAFFDLPDTLFDPEAAHALPSSAAPSTAMVLRETHGEPALLSGPPSSADAVDFIAEGL